MSQVFQVVSHWSASNPIAEQLLDLAIQREIDAQRLSKRYRRLAFYFFQKEITSDIREKLSPSYLHIGQTITDPEIQSLVARSALGHIATETIAIYPSTILINDYLLGQENFAYDNSESDAIFAKKFLSLLNKKNAPAFLLNTTKNRVSDVLLVLRRRRADLILIKNLLDGQYGYRTLVQACGEYLAQYACVPLIFDYLQKNRSSDSFLYFLEEDTQLQLRTLLTPQYELVAQIIPLAHTYGSVSLEKSPYATSFARLGFRRSQRPWWVKIVSSIAIVLLSGFFGGRSLLILPVIRGLLQGATTAWQYLHTLSRMFHNRYYQYTAQHQRYVEIYEDMIDPERSTHHTLQSEQLMNDRYDMTPFGGHDLNRDVHQSAQNIVSFYSRIISDPTTLEQFRKEFAHILATTNWSSDNHLSLWIVSSQIPKEQTYYRLLQLIHTTKKDSTIDYDRDAYHQHYDAITEVVGTKTLKFNSQTWIRSLTDGFLVAASSGVLGRLGSYLRNRNVVSSHAFAAGANVTGGLSLDNHITPVLDKQLLSRLQEVLSPDDIQRFSQAIIKNDADTVWRTLKNTFGHHMGNATNTAMMDTRWRSVDQFGDSELFTQAFANHLPLGPQDARWTDIIHFLDRIYNYDNFADYKPLIHQQRLPDTLQGLHDGTVTLSDFASLSQPQREIITQLAFTAIRKEDIVGLIMDIDSVESLVVTTGASTTLTGSSVIGSGSLQTGDINQTIIATGIHNPVVSGSTIISGSQGSSGVVFSGSAMSGDISLPWLSRLTQRWTSLGSSSFDTTGTIDTITGGHTVIDAGSLNTGSIETGSLDPLSGLNFFAPRQKLYSGLNASLHSFFSDVTGSVETGVNTISGSSLTSGTLQPQTNIIGSLSLGGFQLFSGIQTFLLSGWEATQDFFSSLWLSSSPATLPSQSGSIVTGNIVTGDVLLTGDMLSGQDFSGNIPEVNVIVPPTQLPSFTLPVFRSKRSFREIVKNHLQL